MLVVGVAAAAYVVGEPPGRAQQDAAQVLVWSDMAGMNRGRKPKFVKQYADLGGILLDAAQRFADDVRGGSYPDDEHSYT